MRSALPFDCGEYGATGLAVVPTDESVCAQASDANAGQLSDTIARGLPNCPMISSLKESSATSAVWWAVARMIGQPDKCSTAMSTCDFPPFVFGSGPAKSIENVSKSELIG